MKIIYLNDRAVIHLQGVDAGKLLQGIITNNVNLLGSQPAIFSALLSPQGKFLHDFFVVKYGDDLLIDTEVRQAEGLIALLKRYRLRAKVEINVLPWNVYYSDVPLQTELCFADPRHDALGFRTFSEQALSPNADIVEYHRLRIQNCVPEGLHDLIYDKSYMLENNYDLIHAIDFNKGCYVGQEVTARSKYRGVIRKKIYTVQGDCENLPPFGTKIMAGDAEIGEMRSSVGNIGLAQLRCEDLATVKDLQCNSFMLQITNI
jgi:folate-binding protein YgfZ